MWFKNSIDACVVHTWICQLEYSDKLCVITTAYVKRSDSQSNESVVFIYFVCILLPFLLGMLGSLFRLRILLSIMQDIVS